MQSKKIKICFVTDGIFPYAIGGIQRHSLLLLSELIKNPHLEITIIHPHKGKIIFPESKSHREIVVDDIDVNRFYIYECYKYSKRVYQVIRSMDFDIIYAQGITVWNNIDKVKEKLIVNLHGLEPFQAIGLKNRLIAIPFKWIFKYILKKAKYSASEGGKLTEILKSFLPAQKVIYLNNATNIKENDFVRNKSVQPIKFLFVGRFATNKGINLLLDAVQSLNESDYATKFTLQLIGKGPLFEDYSNNRNYHNVTYSGFVDDKELENSYKNCDVFILPSLFEGMPTVVLEAMNYKLPVIVSDIGAAADMVNNENGKLIKPGLTTEIITAIKHMIDLDEKSRLKLGDSSFNKLRNNFTWPLAAKKHLDLFEQIIIENKK